MPKSSTNVKSKFKDIQIKIDREDSEVKKSESKELSLQTKSPPIIFHPETSLSPSKAIIAKDSIESDILRIEMKNSLKKDELKPYKEDSSKSAKQSSFGNYYFVPKNEK